MVSAIFAKISPYNIINYMIPGTIFCLLIKYLVGWNFIDFDNWYLSALVFYFSGMICSRVGSLVVEKCIKCLFGVRFADYADYLRAEKMDEMVGKLNQECNAFRTYVAMILILILAMLWNWVITNCPCIAGAQKVIFILFLLVLFLSSYVKQIGYVVKRVKACCHKTESLE